MALGTADYIAILFIIGLIFFVLWRIIRRRKTAIPYHEISFADDVYRRLKTKMNDGGLKVHKGTLQIGYESNKVNKICEFKGQEDIFEYDQAGGIYKQTEDSQQYNFMLFQIKSKSFIMKLFGLKNRFYLINKDIIDIHFDIKTKTWKIPKMIDFHSYGNVMIADDTSKHYLRKLSLTFFDESLQTHLMNNPNRIIAQDLEHAKRVNLIKEGIETEMKKYESAKRASETVMT